MSLRQAVPVAPGLPAPDEPVCPSLGHDWATGDSFTVSDEGTHTVSYRSVDRAGNVEKAQGLTVQVDVTPPAVSDSSDGLWHRGLYIVGLIAVDTASGMSGDLACVEYSRDGGLTWQQGTQVLFRARKRDGGSGERELLYRATDAAGNRTSPPASTLVRLDARPPGTLDDAPWAPQIRDTTVHFTAVDSRSGVAETRYSLDDGDWRTGSSVTVPAADNEGAHWIAYYSVDRAGNVEHVQWCRVLVTGVETIALGSLAPAIESRPAGMQRHRR